MADEIPRTPVRPPEPPKRPEPQQPTAPPSKPPEPEPKRPRPPEPPRPARHKRSWRWLYYLIVLIAIAAAVLYFTGHLPGVGQRGGSPASTAPPPVGNGYLATTSSSVIFIQWNQAGTATSGVAQMAEVQGQAPDQRITVKSAPVTGQINDSNVSVDFEGVVQVFGTTSDGGFVLDFPQPDGSLGPVKFLKASAQDYNDALAALRTRVDQSNAEAPSPTST